MRPEISNELLLQVIQSWQPDEAKKWRLNKNKYLMWGTYFIRSEDSYAFSHNEHRTWHEASKLVEFLLKDRPILHCEWESSVLRKVEKDYGTSWSCDPFSHCVTGSCIACRIKSYEYLKEWKESQEPNRQEPETYEQYCDWCHQEPGCVPLSLEKWSEACKNECTVTVQKAVTIDPHDVTLTIDGQAIEGMEIHDDVLEVPATHETICPHCNGSKEVVGWHGKESCQACS